VPIIFTVVNSHLAAFDDHLERRNTDFHDISRRIEFGPCAGYLWTPRTRDSDAGPRVLNIYASDVLFWLVSHRNNLGYRRLSDIHTTGGYVTSEYLPDQSMLTCYP
jgi:hypothetical protein